MSDLFDRIGERLLKDAKQSLQFQASQTVFFLKEADEGTVEVGEGEFVTSLNDEFVQIQNNGGVLGYPVESIADDAMMSVLPASKVYGSEEECKLDYPELFQQAEKKASDYLSVVPKRTAWIINDDTDDQLTNKNLQQRVVSFVRSFLSNYDIPAQFDLKFYTVRNGSYEEQDVLDSGDVSVGFQLRTISNVKIKADLTIPVRGGQIIEPSVLFVNGNPRIISQSTFDDIVGNNTFYQKMHGNPESIVTPEVLKMYQQTKIPTIRPGIFGPE